MSATPDPPGHGTRTIDPEADVSHVTSPDTAQPSPAATPPPRLGRFEIKRVLGEGVFGRVYEAFDPSLKRVVALKVAKPEQLVGEYRLERFHREAQAAANLQHPNIVAVFDHGEDGANHYIASAFVPGVPLDSYLAGLSGPPSAEEAARIVRRLAGALSYAHRAGVIHRDVKPANVLLRSDGHPMLTDFGLAARLVEDAPLPTPEEAIAFDGPGKLTRAGSVVGTPAYLAPEQWRGQAEAASDQYSLGCVLYELLTGQTPFSGGSSAHYAALHQMHPPPPPRTVRPGVPRDLEAICLKCLEKLPQRRYADCQALAQDLRRWEEGEPVAARPPSAGERLAKWARRRPAVAGLLAAMTFTVAVALGLVSWQWRHALDQKAQADEARIDAEQQRGKAEKAREAAALLAEQEKTARTKADEESRQARQARDFLASLFRASNPSDFGGYFLRRAREKGGELTARQLLERGDRDLRDKLKDQPQVRATLLMTVGDVFRGMGRYDEARARLREALALLERQPGPGHAEYARCQFFLAWVELDRGDFDAAEAMLQQALRVQQARLPADDPATVDTKLLLAWHRTICGDPGGLPLWREVVAARTRRHGAKHPETLLAKGGLVAAYIEQERWLEAVPHIAELMNHGSRIEGGETNLQAGVLIQTGVVASRQGFHGVAVRYYEQSLALARRQLGDDHLYLVLILHELGSSLARLNKLAEAEKRFAECQRILRGSVGLAFPRAILTHREYAQVLRALHRLHDARALWAEALEANTRQFGPENRWRFYYLAQLAEYEARTGNEAKAAELTREALRLRERARGKATDMAADLCDLGWALFHNRKADHTLAEACFRESDRVWRGVPDGFAHERWLLLARFSSMLHAQGRYREAEPGLIEAGTAGQRLSMLSPLDKVFLPAKLGDIELARGRIDEATARYRESLAFARKLNPPSPHQEAAALVRLAGPSAELRRWDEAVATLREASSRPQPKGPPLPIDNAHRFLAYVETAAGRPAEARRWLDAFVREFRHHPYPLVRLYVIRGALVVAPDYEAIAANSHCQLAELDRLAALLPGEPAVAESKALALLRAGRSDDAGTFLKEQSAAHRHRQAFWTVCRAWSAALRAEIAEARRLHALAGEQVGRLAPNATDPDAAAVSWHERLELRLLLDEVGRLVSVAK